MVNNLLNEMDFSKQKYAVLITGGFHTSGISNLLKNHDISYTVISPALRENFSSKTYFDFMMKDKIPRDILLSLPSFLARIMLLDSGILDFDAKRAEILELKNQLANVSDTSSENPDSVTSSSILEKINIIKKQLETSPNDSQKWDLLTLIDEIETDIIFKSKNIQIRMDLNTPSSNPQIQSPTDNSLNEIIPLETAEANLQSGSYEATGGIDFNAVLNAAANNDNSKLTPNSNVGIIEQNIEHFFSAPPPPLLDTTIDKRSYVNQLLQAIGISFIPENSNLPVNIINDDLEDLILLFANTYNSSISSLDLDVESLLKKIQKIRIQMNAETDNKQKQIISSLIDFIELKTLTFFTSTDININTDTRQGPDQSDFTAVNDITGIIHADNTRYVLSRGYEATGGIDFDGALNNMALNNISKEPVIWSPTLLNKCFDRFFSGKTSAFSTNADKKIFLNRMLKIIGIPFIPGDGETAGDAILKNLEKLNKGEKVYIFSAFTQDNEDILSIYKDFYRAIIKNSSEAELLAIFRKVLGIVRRIKLMDEIIATDFTGDKKIENFKELIKKVVQLIYEKENDSLRNINWIGKQQYMDNLHEFITQFKVTENTNIGTFKINFSPHTIEFNPNNLLKILPDFKQINFSGKMNDGRTFTTNLLASYLITSFLHEIRGHLKHNTKSEEMAFREQGSRFAIINYASFLFALARLNYVTNNKSFSNIKEFYNNAAEILLREYSLRTYIPVGIKRYSNEIKSVVIKLAEFFEDYSKNILSSKKIYKLDQVIPILSNNTYMDPNRFPGPLSGNLTANADGITSRKSQLFADYYQKWENFFTGKILEGKISKNFYLEQISIIAAYYDLINDEIITRSKELDILPNKYLKDVNKLKAFLNSLDLNLLAYVGEINSELNQVVINEMALKGDNLKTLSAAMKPKELNKFVLHKIYKNFIIDLSSKFARIDFDPENDVSSLLEIISKDSGLMNQKDSLLQIINTSERLDLALLFRINQSFDNLLIPKGSTYRNILANYFYKKILINSHHIFNEENLLSQSNNLEAILINLKIPRNQINEIISYFDSIFIDNTKESLDKNESIIFDLFIKTIFLIQECKIGGLTENNQQVVSEGILESVAIRYNLKDEMKDYLKNIIDNPFKSKNNLTETASNNTISVLFNRYSLLLDFLNQIKNTSLTNKSIQSLEISDGYLSIRFSDDDYLKLTAQNFKIDILEAWENLKIENFDQSISIVNLIDKLTPFLIIPSLAKILQTFNSNHEKNDPKSINIIINKGMPEDEIESIICMLNLFNKEKRTENVYLLGDEQEFIRNVLTDNGLSQFKIVDSPVVKNGGILVGRDKYFQDIQKIYSEKNLKGLFFVDNFNSPFGALLISIAYAFNDGAIIDELKNSSLNESSKRDIQNLWDKLSTFSEDSKSDYSVMPVLSPILKYLLKQLGNEDITILNAA
ncbi:MAG: hypothetical protein ACD_79C00466G0001 [uncultured bacterium]|nr:MAG: hypothetical protein ACD_79C00466G0001 [uncultured bacterium]